MIIEFFGGWFFVRVPWLAGMVYLFAFEFIDSNTVTRLYFLRLRRLDFVLPCRASLSSRVVKIK